MEQTRGSVPMPPVRMREQRDTLLAPNPAELRKRAWLVAIRHDSPNAAAVVACVQVEIRFQRLRQRPGMFDRLAVHVAKPETAIRRIRECDGTEPVVPAGEEF